MKFAVPLAEALPLGVEPPLQCVLCAAAPEFSQALSCPVGPPITPLPLPPVPPEPAPAYAISLTIGAIASVAKTASV